METKQLATFGGGCFWCTEAIFNRVEGVSKITPGYSGGTVKNPNYKEVCSGTTGHAEVIQLEYNPQIINYKELLDIFFATHNPTTLNQQGNDKGTQYRSVIFYHSDAQKNTAQNSIAELNASGKLNHPIVTQILPLECFYTAEIEHHNYFEIHPEQSYCKFVIHPKVKKFEAVYGVKKT